jgi:hypothetical protein
MATNLDVLCAVTLLPRADKERSLSSLELACRVHRRDPLGLCVGAIEGLFFLWQLTLCVTLHTDDQNIYPARSCQTLSLPKRNTFCYNLEIE